MTAVQSRSLRLRRARLMSGCALLALTLPMTAVAQDTDTQLDAVLVSSASGKATSVQDAPASITVIDASELAATGARDLQDALRSVPGLNITRGNDGGSSVSFRGMSSSRTLTLVDGRRMGSRNTMPRDYQGDLGVVPVDAIERIEVVRGPMSTLYGSDAMGGVINIITKKGYDVWSGSLTTEFTAGDASTTADGRSISAFVTGPVAQDVTVSFWGKYAKVDSPKADAEGTAANKGSDTRTLGARLNWAQSDSLSWGAEVGATTEKYLATEATGGNPSREVTRQNIGFTNLWTLGSGQLDSALRFEFSENQPLAAGSEATSYDTVNFETRYTDMTQLAGRDLDYTLGMSISREELNDPLTSGNLIAGAANTAALYGEGRLQFSDALTLTAGLRIDEHDKFGTHLTPRLYANYDFGNGLTLKAGYSQAFVAPDLRNLNPNYEMGSRGNGCKPYQGPCTIVGNPNLKPETSDNYEIGLNYQGTGFSWEVTGFYNDVEDMISARRTGRLGTDGRPLFQRDNFDYGKTAGIEAGFSKDLTDSLTWTGTGTWIAKSEFKYGDFPTPYPMATTPEWNINTGLAWQANDRLKLNGNVNYVGKQAGYVIADDIPPVPGGQVSVPAGQNSKAYFLVNVGAAYDLNDKTVLNLGIDNLFDAQPESDVSYRENGRLFRVGVTTRF